MKTVYIICEFMICKRFIPHENVTSCKTVDISKRISNVSSKKKNNNNNKKKIKRSIDIWIHDNYDYIVITQLHMIYLSPYPFLIGSGSSLFQMKWKGSI
jgi:hypothetical protein